MHRLTATYDVQLANWVRVKRADDDQLCFSAPIGEFLVEVVLVRNGGASIKEFGEDHPTRPVTQITVSVSRAEDSEPPAVPRNEKGGRDFSARAVWFGDRAEAYRRAAVAEANRAIRFFKYKLHTPHLREFSPHDREFPNPKWTNEDGEEVDSGRREGSLTVLTGSGPRLLGQKNFTANDDSELQKALEHDLSIETYQEFLSDAQTSIHDGNLRRAVLEMAIACEVAVNQAFFAKTPAAGLAFEYLEDKGHIRVSI